MSKVRSINRTIAVNLPTNKPLPENAAGIAEKAIHQALAEYLPPEPCNALNEGVSGNKRIRDANKPPQDELYCWATESALLSEAFAEMTPHAAKVLLYLMGQHATRFPRGNGRLTATYEALIKYQCGSRRMIARSLRELEQLGIVERTAKGRLLPGGKHVPSMYALTWYPLCNGKLASNRWRSWPSRKAEVARLARHGSNPTRPPKNKGQGLDNSSGEEPEKRARRFRGGTGTGSGEEPKRGVRSSGEEPEKAAVEPCLNTFDDLLEGL